MVVRFQRSPRTMLFMILRHQTLYSYSNPSTAIPINQPTFANHESDWPFPSRSGVVSMSAAGGFFYGILRNGLPTRVRHFRRLFNRNSRRGWRWWSRTLVIIGIDGAPTGHWIHDYIIQIDTWECFIVIGVAVCGEWSTRIANLFNAQLQIRRNSLIITIELRPRVLV